MLNFLNILDLYSDVKSNLFLSVFHRDRALEMGINLNFKRK